ncbi:hypothetical protein WFS22_02500 [Ureaplasma parvum]|nr:hypothetical protein [Ureaplasma parvum]EDT49229.1 hypothetical protein UPA1_G0615 [Ureaplasma parvum serovar 1 str. ATCC 27813]EDU19230.1 hypothetical protein UPA6_A0377 [Ureaplasma parvum serovar 6 str. ATCC 27818]
MKKRTKIITSILIATSAISLIIPLIVYYAPKKKIIVFEYAK